MSSGEDPTPERPGPAPAARDSWYDYWAPTPGSLPGPLPRQPGPPPGPPTGPPTGWLSQQETTLASTPAPRRRGGRFQLLVAVVGAAVVLATGWRLGLFATLHPATSPAGQPAGVAGIVAGDAQAAQTVTGGVPLPPMRTVVHPHRVLPQATPPAGPDAYSLLAPPASGQAAATWDPCEPIHYVVRPDHAPPDGEALLARAFAAVSAASGLQFVSDGTTSEAPREGRAVYQPERYGQRWAPVLVAWTGPGEVPQLAGAVAGRAGPVIVTETGQPPRMVSGQVTLDAADLRSAQVQAGGQVRVYDVVLHELGHLVGLGHVTDAGELMGPHGPAVASTGYAVGDLRGLARMGSGTCSARVPAGAR